MRANALIVLLFLFITSASFASNKRIEHEKERGNVFSELIEDSTEWFNNSLQRLSVKYHNAYNSISFPLKSKFREFTASGINATPTIGDLKFTKKGGGATPIVKVHATQIQDLDGDIV